MLRRSRKRRRPPPPPRPPPGRAPGAPVHDSPPATRSPTLVMSPTAHRLAVPSACTGPPSAAKRLLPARPPAATRVSEHLPAAPGRQRNLPRSPFLVRSAVPKLPPGERALLIVCVGGWRLRSIRTSPRWCAWCGPGPSNGCSSVYSSSSGRFRGHRCFGAKAHGAHPERPSCRSSGCPWLFIPKDSVEDSHELAHAGDDGDLCRLSGSSQAMIGLARGSFLRIETRTLM